MADELRERRIIVALGAPGKGKTALAKMVIADYRRRHGERSVHIIDPSYSFDGEGVWPGRNKVPKQRADGKTIWVSAIDAHIDTLTAGGRGPRFGGWSGLLVLDDADRYLTAGGNEYWRDIWLANRHLGLDVLVTAHRAAAVPKDLLGSAYELWLFAMDEPNALKYLAKVPQLTALFDGQHPLPSQKGQALRVVPSQGKLSYVTLFKP